jgi:DNA-nicking Smr family endonuclease
MSKKKDKIDPKSPFAKLREVKEKLAKDEAAEAKAKTPPRTVASTPSAARSTPEEDRLSFHRMMTGVTPLDSPKGRVSPKDGPRATSPAPRARAEQAKTAAQTEADEVHAHLRALVQGDKQFETHDDGRRVEGRRIDVPQTTLRKLRHGTFPIDARVDLHGLDAVTARSSVESFLREKRVAGERCVLIVHGKGEHSPRGRGVLRLEIAGWLAEGAASEHVAAFATAANDDGGEGAVYVLLRR